MPDDTHLIEAWKAAVEVQKHFNTIEMTIRNIFVTLVVAIVAGIGLTFKETRGLDLFSISIPLASILSGIAIVVTFLFYFMDRYWYHKLLVGSVKEAMALEKFLVLPDGTNVALTKRIGDESPIDWHLVPKWMRRILWPLIAEKRFIPEGKVHSDGKISLFYKVVMLLFLALLAGSFLPSSGGNLEKHDNTTLIISI